MVHAKLVQCVLKNQHNIRMNCWWWSTGITTGSEYRCSAEISRSPGRWSAGSWQRHRVLVAGWHGSGRHGRRVSRWAGQWHPGTRRGAGRRLRRLQASLLGHGRMAAMSSWPLAGRVLSLVEFCRAAWMHGVLESLIGKVPHMGRAAALRGDGRPP
jgi:hypothetical protein